MQTNIIAIPVSDLCFRTRQGLDGSINRNIAGVKRELGPVCHAIIFENTGMLMER
jgi:hypothetical protein